ncbi:mitochondrial ribonuclease P catalytic subunit isoform X2 [Brachyhypopomus gauderio]|uniref:mitochondrial ribonuclease P catalytic subunit isoform X2 n=1 Tax=Brachyhypopomus gauderio TaxID=698409 RepID=UPI0040426FC0
MQVWVIRALRSVCPFLVPTRPRPHTPYCTRAQGRPATPKDSTRRESPHVPKSVFAAGTAKRTAEYFKRKTGVGDEQPARSNRVRAFVHVPDQPLTASEWRSRKESSGYPERFELRVMESLLAAGAHLDVAKSLLTYVSIETGSLPYELLQRYLSICVFGGHHSEVSDTYDIMRSCFKTLDTGAYSLLVKGLSRTERWREALVLLEDIKKVITPSTRNYSDAIAGAVLHGDRETGWTLYGELLEQGLTPNQDTWQCLFDGAGSQHEHKDKLLAILSYMRENQAYPETPLAASIKTWFESLPDERWKGTFSSVDPRGVCRSCRTNLESIQLTEDEYGQLKHRVMMDVIEGKDVFNKTTPEELDSFKAFVEKRAAFDVVVDGLNVAHVSPQCVKSETLLAVVSELEERGLNVLVLGRKHMLNPSRNWARRDMQQLRQKAHCFFTENILIISQL